MAAGICYSLTPLLTPQEIEMRPSVTTIGDSAFTYCRSLINVVIGSGITNISDTAFYHCTKLMGVYLFGNAPAVGDYALADTTATVYYLPGTMGWSSTFRGCPTALWYLPNPLILNQSQNASFGITSNQFGFTISWATNVSVVVEGSTNLVNWDAVATNALSSGTNYFSDATWINYPQRFYRVRAE
jgi:hypothetical protein